MMHACRLFVLQEDSRLLLAALQLLQLVPATHQQLPLPLLLHRLLKGLQRLLLLLLLAVQLRWVGSQA
jgi:hypothetical protein